MGLEPSDSFLDLRVLRGQAGHPQDVDCEPCAVAVAGLPVRRFAVRTLPIAQGGEGPTTVGTLQRQQLRDGGLLLGLAEDPIHAAGRPEQHPALMRRCRGIAAKEPADLLQALLGLRCLAILARRHAHGQRRHGDAEVLIDLAGRPLAVRLPRPRSVVALQRPHAVQRSTRHRV